MTDILAFQWIVQTHRGSSLRYGRRRSARLSQLSGRRISGCEMNGQEGQCRGRPKHGHQCQQTAKDIGETGQQVYSSRPRRCYVEQTGAKESVKLALAGS
jgi:hypothetical protein